MLCHRRKAESRAFGRGTGEERGQGDPWETSVISSGVFLPVEKRARSFAAVHGVLNAGRTLRTGFAEGEGEAAVGSWEKVRRNRGAVTGLPCSSLRGGRVLESVYRGFGQSSWGLGHIIHSTTHNDYYN